MRAEAAGIRTINLRPADSAALVQEAIFAQRRAERSFKLENYRQKIDSLQAAYNKAQGDISLVRLSAWALPRRLRGKRVGTGEAWLGQPVEPVAGNGPAHEHAGRIAGGAAEREIGGERSSGHAGGSRRIRSELAGPRYRRI